MHLGIQTGLLGFSTAHGTASIINTASTDLAILFCACFIQALHILCVVIWCIAVISAFNFATNCANSTTLDHFAVNGARR